MKKIKYQGNLDVLRGISILLVVFYHLKLDILSYRIFPGGYLGVDIFFVISGYLISSIITKNIENGKFDFKYFFLRRFLRIVPVYIFVIFITLVFGYFILLHSDLYHLARSSGSAILFLSNIFFFYFLNDYYNPEAIFNPLLHTWSLAVEIQFYILFPFLFVFIKKFIKQTYLPLLIIGLMSLLISEVGSYVEPRINFFGLQSRIWEFFLGYFIFFFKDKTNISLNNLIKYLLYFAMVLCAMLFDENSRHPSLITFVFLIIPSILILNKNQKNYFYFDRGLIFFGLFSYSLYIWHYPILSLSKSILFDQGIIIKISLLMLSIILSYCSYYLLEKKLRVNLKKTFYFVIVFLISSLILIGITIKNFGFEDRTKLSDFYKKSTRATVTQFDAPENNFDSYSKKNILIIGNSHALQTYYGFFMNKQLYKDLNFSSFHIQVECFKESIFNQNRDLCKGILDEKEKYLFLKGKKNFTNSNFVILSTRYTDEDIVALPGVIKFLKKNNKKIIIFNSIIDTNKYNTFDNLSSRNLSLLQKNFLNKKFPFEKYLFLNDKYPNFSELNVFEKMYFKNGSTERYKINNKVKKIANEYDVPFLDINSFICDEKNKKCKIVTDRKIHIIADTTGHLTDDGNEYLIKIIYNDLIKIIKNRL